MAKKSRKARVKSRVADISRNPVAAKAQAKSPSAQSKAQANTAAAVFQPQNYAYVKSDLVSIAIIAGALILVLVILTFVPALKS